MPLTSVRYLNLLNASGHVGERLRRRGRDQAEYNRVTVASATIDLAVTPGDGDDGGTAD